MLQLSAEDPRVIGPYEIVGKLGEGGMGTVYKGRSRGGRSVAVKVAKRELADDPDFLGRFRTEIEAVQRVGGFHTAQVIDADPEARPPWMTTAYIPGPTLSVAVAEHGPMDESRLRALGAALAEALQAIHGNGLVHRDLKPANIILGDDGPRVLDFGIARALEATRFTHTHVSVGTPGFFSPEQVQGRDIGPAADVFALGAVLVHAAGGRPFGEGDSMTLMYRAVHDRADLCALPEQLRPLVASCLAKEAGERPTPEDVLERIAPEGGAGAAAAWTTTAPAAPRRPEPEAPAPPGAFGPAPSTFTAPRSPHSPAPAPAPVPAQSSAPAPGPPSGPAPGPAPEPGQGSVPTPASAPGSARASGPTPAPGSTPAPAPERITDARPGPSAGRTSVRPFVPTAPPAGVFQRSWVVRVTECALWFLAFSAVAAPFITLEAVNADDPGSVFHDELPVLLPAKAVYCVFFLLCLRALYPYRVTVAADGIRFRKGLRTVRHSWDHLAAAEAGAAKLVLRYAGGRRRTVRLRWPARGGRYEGLRAALRAHAPSGVEVSGTRVRT